jgi:hypothetical protein
MEPDRDIPDRNREIAEYTGLPAPNRCPTIPGFLPGHSGYFFQIAFYTAIAAFCMAVFFYGRILDVSSTGRCRPEKPTILPNGSFGGLPMFPQQYRLDSVILPLDGV